MFFKKIIFTQQNYPFSDYGNTITDLISGTCKNDNPFKNLLNYTRNQAKHPSILLRKENKVPEINPDFNR